MKRFFLISLIVCNISVSAQTEKLLLDSIVESADYGLVENRLYVIHDGKTYTVHGVQISNKNQ